MSCWKPGMTLKQVELRAIEDALAYFDGNKAKASYCLGVSIRKVRAWVRAHDSLSRFRIYKRFRSRTARHSTTDGGGSEQGE